MPVTGVYSWKEEHLTPEERVDHFFNLIDHAVENGVPLKDLYSREHVKKFLFFLLHRYDEPCKTCSVRQTKGSTMPKLTLTSTFASPLVVGDPGAVTINLNPKETKSVEVSKDQLSLLLPGLEKLKTAGWVTFTVGTEAAAAVKVSETVAVTPKITAPPPPPPPPPAPEPSEEKETPVEEPASPPPAEEAAPVPSAPKAPSFDRKNRNR